MKMKTSPKKTRPGVLTEAMTLADFSSSTQGAGEGFFSHYKLRLRDSPEIQRLHLWLHPFTWKMAKKGGFHPFLHPFLHPLDTCAHCAISISCSL